MQPIEFRKGHGTANDFVLLRDLDDTLQLRDAHVAWICDRRRGVGADGILRITRSAAPDAEFFMDYRNADGSIAEMCGNGARVFVRALLDDSLVTGPTVAFETRAGVLTATVESDGSITIDMGAATDLLSDARVRVGDAWQDATSIAVPNPHAVVFVDDVADAGPLLVAPAVQPDSAFPDGVNVEFVTVVDDFHIQMRVFERGVGETFSCGTGACAAAWAYLLREDRRDGAVIVDVPGGRLKVTATADGRLLLNGPADIVASGTAFLPDDV